MAINPGSSFSGDLSTFGSKVSDIAPSNLPAGVSPDCENMFYYAQSVATRPAFIHALGVNGTFGDAAVMSHAPYSIPGGIFNIAALDSEQNIWEYDVLAKKSTKLLQTSAWLGSTQQKYFSGSQLFNKFFMAFFDPQNGLSPFSCASDIPRYINSLGHCNRVTIDAPGGPTFLTPNAAGALSVENVNLEGLFSNHAIETGFTRANNIVTAILDPYDGNYPLDPSGNVLIPLPGWFVQMYDSDAAVPGFNVTTSWNTSGPLNSGAVQSSGVGTSVAGNVVTVYYLASTGSNSPNAALLAAWNAALAGGYTLYVSIANPAVGPAGIFPVLSVSSSADEAIYFPFPNNSGGTNYEARAWFYISYTVPGASLYQGSNAIPDTTTATFSFSDTAIVPDGTNINGNGMFTNNELYQQIGGTVAMSSDSSGVTKINTSEAITNLPIGAWLYVSIPNNDVVTFAAGWVQVASVVNEYEFSISTPGAQIFSITSATLWQYWGSLNTSVNLSQPVPGNPVGTSYAQEGAQGFQITSVTQLGNGKLQIQWYQLGPDSINGASAGRMALVPQSAEVPGNRQAFCFFLNEDGAASPGSAPINFTTLGGPNFTRWSFPLGPPSTTTRVLAVTTANGADFFALPPANVQSSAAPIITPGTYIYDNITVSGPTPGPLNTYIDWSDAALVAGIPVSGAAGAGSDYGDLTSTINLPPCMGVIAYDDALAWIGEWNTVKGFVNMSFQGGASGISDGIPTGHPLGWDYTTDLYGVAADGTAYMSLAPDGSGWQVTFPNTTDNYNGLISQSAYQDIWGAPIVLPNQSYSLILRASVTASTGGQIVVLLQSQSTDTAYGEAIIPATALTQTLSWIRVSFNVPGTGTLATMPENIPSDLRLVIYRQGNVPNNFNLADVFLVNANTPVITNQIRFSYPENPFGYDDENGYTLKTSVPDPIVSMFQQRKYLYALTTKDLLQTFDTGAVPSEWGLEIFADNCGGSGPNAVDSQDDTAWWIGQHGAQVFAGSKPKKLTQEIEPDIDSINWEYQAAISVAADPIQRVIYFSAPTGESALSNSIFTMNHRMVDASVNITDPTHISPYTGRIIATDLSRKWSPWPVACNSVAMAYILSADGTLTQAMTFGLNSPNGQIYAQDFTNYPPGNPSATAWNTEDADLGDIASFYDTYFFFSHDTEQAAKLALYRKLFCYMSFHARWIGDLTVTPYVDALTNPWSALPTMPSTSIADPGQDLNLGLNVTGERCAFEFGMESGGFWLQHLIVSARPEQVFPVSGVWGAL
jgi:hypothetical protein